MPVRIRNFNLSDLERIVEIEEASFGAEKFTKEIFINYFRKFPDLFLVAEFQGKVIGYIITTIFGNKANIASIAIDESFRKKGIGSKLVKLSFEKLKSKGIKIVELEVKVTNKNAVNFWESLGFAPVKIIPMYYINGTDAIKMEKVLS